MFVHSTDASFTNEDGRLSMVIILHWVKHFQSVTGSTALVRKTRVDNGLVRLLQSTENGSRSTVSAIG